MYSLKFILLQYQALVTRSLSKTSENWAIICINGMQSVTDGTQTKTLCFENNTMIEDSLVKLKMIYNPVNRFAGQFIPGYDPSREHETTSFNMNYQEYQQRELYLLLNDIHWDYTTY